MSWEKTDASLWPVDPTAARGHCPESESRLLPGTFTYSIQGIAHYCPLFTLWNN